MRKHIEKASASSKFNELAGNIPADQLNTLRSLWNYFLHQGKWPAVKEFHRMQERLHVEDTIKNLWGVFIWHERPQPVNYCLTLPAVLAVEGINGSSIKLILSYLKYMKEKFEEDVTFAQVKSDDLLKNTEITNDEISLLGRLISLHPTLWGYSASGLGTPIWGVGVIQGIEELYEANNVEQFLYKICNDYIEGYGRNPQNYPLPDLYNSITRETTIVIPDTNVLIDNPHIERWSFEGINEFTFMLAPTVLSELDDLKSERNARESAKRKAQTVNKKISEYLEQGSLREGIVVAEGRILLQMFLDNPRFYLFYLPWSKNEINNDDLILVTALSVKRNDIRSRVCVITNDLNMRCKANALNIEWLPMAKTSDDVSKDILSA